MTLMSSILLYAEQERVTYNKEIQTTDIPTEASIPPEEELRQRILRERETEAAEQAARDKQLEEESVQLDHEIAQEIRGTCFSN